MAVGTLVLMKIRMMPKILSIKTKVKCFKSPIAIAAGALEFILYFCVKQFMAFIHYFLKFCVRRNGGNREVFTGLKKEL